MSVRPTMIGLIGIVVRNRGKMPDGYTRDGRRVNVFLQVSSRPAPPFHLNPSVSSRSKETRGITPHRSLHVGGVKGD
jgi:hypothetical protein